MQPTPSPTEVIPPHLNIDPRASAQHKRFMRQLNASGDAYGWPRWAESEPRWANDNLNWMQ
jgi:hypothetical protein